MKEYYALIVSDSFLKEKKIVIGTEEHLHKNIITLHKAKEKAVCCYDIMSDNINQATLQAKATFFENDWLSSETFYIIISKEDYDSFKQ